MNFFSFSHFRSFWRASCRYSKRKISSTGAGTVDTQPNLCNINGEIISLKKLYNTPDYIIKCYSSLVPRPLPRFRCYTQKRGVPGTCTCIYMYTYTLFLKGLIQSVEVLVCNRALIILIAVSQLPLKLKLYVSLWTSGRCVHATPGSEFELIVRSLLKTWEWHGSGDL